MKLTIKEFLNLVTNNRPGYLYNSQGDLYTGLLKTDKDTVAIIHGTPENDYLTLDSLRTMLTLGGHKDDMTITVQDYNQADKFHNICHISGFNINVISYELPVGICSRTGDKVYPSHIDGYGAYCISLDEDLNDMEYTKMTFKKL